MALSSDRGTGGGLRVVVALALTMLLAATAAAQMRTYRGVNTHLGHDLDENRVRVDVKGSVSPDGGTQGRGQLYFESEAAKKLADLINVAFIHQLRVEV